MTTPESYSDMRVDSWPPPPRIAMAIHTAIQVHAYGLFTPPAQIRAAPAIYGAPLPMCLRRCTILGLGGGGGVRDENVSQVWRQTFGRHFPDTGRNVSQKLPDFPTRAQTKKYYGSRMCHECVTESLARKYVLGSHKFAFGAGGSSQRACLAKGQRQLPNHS